MKAKLTLTIDKSAIEQAKTYAEEQGRSLSALIENYMKALKPKSEISIEKDESKMTDMSDVLKRLIGSVKLPKDFDYKEERTKYLTEKYLSKDE